MQRFTLSILFTLFTLFIIAIAGCDIALNATVTAHDDGFEGDFTGIIDDYLDDPANPWVGEWVVLTINDVPFGTVLAGLDPNITLVYYRYLFRGMAT